MASFCVQCGSAVSPEARFCNNCGAMIGGPAQAQANAAPVPPAPVPPAPAPSATPAPAAASGSPILKIVLVIVGIMFAIGIISIAGLIYAGHVIKNKAQEVARDYGIDPHAPSGRVARRVDPCSLLSKEEASRIVGVTIARVESDGDSCHYGVGNLSDEDREREIERARTALEKENSPEAAGNMAKAVLGAVTANNQSFTVQVHWHDGRQAMAGMKIASRAMQGSAGPDIKVAEALSGVGDEAIMGPLDSILIFSKGDTAVQLDLRLMTGARAKAIEMAKLIASRLEF